MKFKYIYVFLGLSSLLLSCTQGGKTNVQSIIQPTELQTIYIQTLKPDLLTSREYTNISLIKTYPTHHTCDGDKRFVNLYICRNNNQGDTLFVFEPCCPTPDYLREDSKDKNTLSIAKDDIAKSFPDSVFVETPVNVKLDKCSKFVFAKILPLSE